MPRSILTHAVVRKRVDVRGSLSGSLLKREVELSEAEKQERKEAFNVGMRQTAMEWDAMDFDRDARLDFDEFSRLVRGREMAIHSEDSLRARFVELDKDGSGRVEMPEVIKFALRDALSRSAVPIATLLSSWDTDENGEVDRDEFRRAVRFFGFRAVSPRPEHALCAQRHSLSSSAAPNAPAHALGPLGSPRLPSADASSIARPCTCRCSGMRRWMRSSTSSTRTAPAR